MNAHYVDLSYHSLNKYGEELCGDKVEVIKSENRTIVVLADGLGSGVKANILATLTSKIMITMLDKGATLQDTIDTITNTLPVCQVRKIAYATFTIVDIDKDLNCKIIEFDNPPTFLLRKHRLRTVDKKPIYSSGKKVMVSEFKLQIGDEIIVVSDGVIHAGVGKFLNHGWEWRHVAEYIENQELKSADKLNRRLIEVCHKLYDNKPGDDTTAIAIKIRLPEKIQLLTGPPTDSDLDKDVVETFIKKQGKKIVCGGTAANIVSRELKREIITDIKYLDPKIPPIAKIRGIDLVTEGVLTLKMVYDELKRLNTSCEEPIFNQEDGVSKLLKLLIEDSTHINIHMGHAINPAHQNPNFPSDLSIKVKVVEGIVEELRTMGKIVTLIDTDR
ncbi:serine/threonine-protein phosphatase [Acidaminobacter sp. JC074]|nr:serine/threonine-protein phosphatase [Acidaminobacter sp. JC074]